MITLPFWIGCDGCRRADSGDKKPQAGKAIAPVEDFTFGPASPLPSGATTPVTGIKPGHWFTLRQSIRSNKIDRRGDLIFHSFVRDPASATSSGAPASSVSCTRPAVLPKGRMKRLDVRLLASDNAIDTSRRISTSGSFQSDLTFAESIRTDHNVMRSGEYFFVILTTRPERFATFQVADWVQAPTDSEALVLPPKNYRIVFPRTAGLLSLPETMLDWTSTAVLFWDDVSASEMTAEQRRALVDWLHFGGRMIVNGESKASELAASELGPLLPISVDAMVSLDTDAMSELIEKYSVPGDDSKLAVTSLVREQASRVSIGGPLSNDSMHVPRTGDLLAIRPVGRGEIVMSRFDLTSDWMLGWRSRESFFNAVALSRPGRRYVQEDVLVQRYINGNEFAMGGAKINTSLRIVSRDARLPIASERVATSGEQATISDEFTSHPVTGLGGWRDEGDVARMLQSVLRDKAGITIPTVPFVTKSLALYLALLVPVNYFVFRLLGRLEWAWLALPVIGLAGAAWIARTVSLDLGLARNRSEVSMIELQPGYSRGHLTRFGSIYNSLSGTYQMNFDSPDAVAYPIDSVSKEPILGAPPVLRFGYSTGLSLDNFSVPSNRARMFHAEQIVDVGGPIELASDSLRNGTSLTMNDAVVVRKSMDGLVEYANIETLAPGARVQLKWSENVASMEPPSDESSSMTASLLRTASMPNGTSRLVGQLDKPFEGITILPEAPVQSVTNIVFANLGYPPREFSTGDANLMPKRKKTDTIVLEGDVDASTIEESPNP